MSIFIHSNAENYSNRDEKKSLKKKVASVILDDCKPF